MVGSTNSAGPTAASLAGFDPRSNVGWLKDALSQGVQKAVACLGHAGGFATIRVKIPMRKNYRWSRKPCNWLARVKWWNDLSAR